MFSARAAAWVERLCSARRKASARKAASYLRRLSGFGVSFMTKERYHPILSRFTRPPHYALTPKSRLYLTAFLATSLPNALARLAPTAQRTDFVKRGSFQYCFFVDDVLVYTAYLRPDPHYLAEGDVQPVLHQPLLTPETSRKKNQSLWGHFLANGGKKALPEGTHLLRLVIRPYLQSPLLQVGPVLAVGQVALNFTTAAFLAELPL